MWDFFGQNWIKYLVDVKFRENFSLIIFKSELYDFKTF